MDVLPEVGHEFIQAIIIRAAVFVKSLIHYAIGVLDNQSLVMLVPGNFKMCLFSWFILDVVIWAFS